MSESEQLLIGEKLGKRIGITNPDFCKMLGIAFREQQLEDIQKFGRKKVEPVHGISILDDEDTGGQPSNGEDGGMGDREWDAEGWMKQNNH
jgi:hypothetical protein